MKIINSQYESRVKRNAVIIYLLASLLCVGMIYYIVNLKKSINYQKENIERNDKILSLTNTLIDYVNKAQSHANIYTYTIDKSELDQFNFYIESISLTNDSISRICNTNNNNNIELLNQIISLLKDKEIIIKEISSQLSYFNPYQEIYNIINNYQPKKNKVTTVSKTIHDTIVYKTEKKGLFKRIGDVFSPDRSIDSMVLVSKTTIDTIAKEEDNESTLLNDIQLYTEKGRKEYLRQINNIENKYQSLIASDQQITKEISTLLIILHRQTLDSVVNEIQKSEDMINNNINLSILIASIALLIILTFIFLIFYDVKKVILARKATEEAIKRTEEIMESRHKLLLSVSHDVKAPLSSILGYLELMQLDTENGEEQRQITSMRNSAEHILSLLTNLLNFSRLDQGKETPIFSEFNINSLCDDLRDMFRPLAENKHLVFKYENLIDDNSIIYSDALKIKQIISNLLSNAIKYSIKGDVIFKVDKDDDKIIFDIIDEGVGIPDDKKEEIFKPFSRIENKESIIEGSGFGLFVVKGLIELLDGDINIYSEENKGTHFNVVIPVKFIENKETIKPTNDIQNISVEKELNILIIDDDNTLLAVIKSMIDRLGIRCDICHSSIEFAYYIENLTNYDLILTDREMGAFSGHDVLRTIKSIDNNKKVVLMTARSEYNEDIAIDKGFDGYLRKPFSIKDLAHILNKDINIEGKTALNKINEEFHELSIMFDNDEDAIRQILKVFVNCTSDNLLAFNNIINDDNFNNAVDLCHKMNPMFIQLEQKELSYFLTKMDKLRGHNASDYPEWKEDLIDFMNKTDDFLNHLSEEYGIE